MRLRVAHVAELFLLFIVACVSSFGDQDIESQLLLCVLVPFRDGCGFHGVQRSQQLDTFVHNITLWLEARGHSWFSIIVSEQSQTGLFNKGLLFNLGMLQAHSQGCDYVVLHDVDQLPSHEENDYFYTGQPLHMCSWSTQYGPNDGYQPHVGGALMMSIEEYAAVNGFSNEYWRWGFEDNDMFERLHTIFGGIGRLNQAAGAYTALPHPRKEGVFFRMLPEVERSRQRWLLARGRDAAALEQMQADGLRQACDYADLLSEQADAARRLTVVTWDLHPLHRSSCSGSAPNSSKADAEAARRRDLSVRGSCLHLLRSAGLPVNLNSPSAPGPAECTATEEFCVATRSTAAIRRSTLDLDSAERQVSGPVAGPAPGPIPVRQPLEEWRRVLTPAMQRPFSAPPPPREDHPFAMGWNESMAFLRMLARRRVPFALTRWGDGELSILRNEFYAARGACARPECPLEWSWDPAARGAARLRRLLVSNFEAARDPAAVAMLGLPLYFCAEGATHYSRGGGGNAALVSRYFDVPDLELHAIPSSRFVYSWQFGNLNYKATFALIETLQLAAWPILVICNRERVGGRMAPTWAAGVLTVRGEDVAHMGANVEAWEAEAALLARSVNGSALLFAAGPLSNALIGVMHSTNPRNIYLDVGGALDYELSGRRTRDFHPLDNDPRHFVRAGGALQAGQECTETRWLLGSGRFVPV